MKQTSMIKAVSRLALMSAAGLLVACSGSSSSSDSGEVSDASISGMVVAAPVSNADVSVVDVTGVAVAEVVAVQTDAAGQYTNLVIPNGFLGQNLIVKSTGGAFLDEATGGQPGEVGDGEMFAYVSANSLSSESSVSVTPGSTIIAHLVMQHGKTIEQAKDAFFKGFGYFPDTSVSPVDATVAAVDASDAAKLAGLRAAAFSQMALNLGLSQNDQFLMFIALAQDLSDGMLNGLMAGADIEINSPSLGVIKLPADILKRSANAMLDFQTGGYSEMALTSTYRVEYIQGMMSAMAGKSTFKFRIKNRSTGDPEPGLMPMVMPMMYMSGHSHSSPLTDVTDNGDGTYTVTIYYLMPSGMNGMSMGYWDLGVTVENKTVHFYPNVMMSMGDTALVKLKGVDDEIMSMMTGTMVGRTYTIFKESLTGGAGSYNFSVFVVAQESMMSFPAVFDGSELSGNSLDATVEISDDDGANWSLATDNGDGIWSVNGLSLTDGVEDQIRVRLTVDDTVYNEVKTTNGLVQEPGVNDYQTFTVRPGMGMM